MAFLVLVLNEREMIKDNDSSLAVEETLMLQRSLSCEAFLQSQPPSHCDMDFFTFFTSQISWICTHNTGNREALLKWKDQYS